MNRILWVSAFGVELKLGNFSKWQKVYTCNSCPSIERLITNLSTVSWLTADTPNDPGHTIDTAESGFTIDTAESDFTIDTADSGLTVVTNDDSGELSAVGHLELSSSWLNSLSIT